MLREDADQFAWPYLELFRCKLLDFCTIGVELSVAVPEPSRSARSGEIIQSGAAYLAIDDVDSVQHREAEKHLGGIVANPFAPHQRHQNSPGFPAN